MKAMTLSLQIDINILKKPIETLFYGELQSLLTVAMGAMGRRSFAGMSDGEAFGGGRLRQFIFNVEVT